jgi:hypothetical protein
LVSSSVVFAVGHWVTELITTYLLDFKFFILGTPTNPVQLEKLQERFAFDMFTEAVWVAAAGCVVLIVQWLLRPQVSECRRRHAWIAAVLLGMGYCWVRWGIWWLSKAIPFDYSEGVDFCAAMGLAGAAGLMLAAWRRKMNYRAI